VRASIVDDREKIENVHINSQAEIRQKYLRLEFAKGKEQLIFMDVSLKEFSFYCIFQLLEEKIK